MTSPNKIDPKAVVVGASKKTKYEKAPKRPTKGVLGKTFAIPVEWTMVVLQVRDKTDMDYVHESLLPQFEALGRQNDPGQVILTGIPKTPYGVISGLHRLAGCEIKGWDFLATVEDIAMDDRQGQLEAALSSNVPNKPMSPFEIAKRGQELLDFGNSLVRIAAIFNISRASLSKRLKLNQLIPELHPLVLSGELTVDMAAQVADFPSDMQVKTFKKFRDLDTTKAAEALQILRYTQGYGVQRKVSPEKKRATIARALALALYNLDKLLAFEPQDIKEYFADAEGEVYTTARDLKNIIESARRFEKIFSDTLGLERQFGAESNQPSEKNRGEVADAGAKLKLLLSQAVQAGNMSAKDFKAIFAGKNPETVHQFLAREAGEAATGLAGLKKRILEDARQSRF